MARRSRHRKTRKPVILVVEDEPTILALIASNIEDDLGYATLSAANAREALALLKEDKAIDLLFTDVNIPDGTAGALDGIGLARRVIELHPNLPVIYTSGGGLTDGMTALFVEGSTFLPKPYTREQLIAAIQDTASRSISSVRRRD